MVSAVCHYSVVSSSMYNKDCYCYLLMDDHSKSYGLLHKTGDPSGLSCVSLVLYPQACITRIATAIC